MSLTQGSGEVRQWTGDEHAYLRSSHGKVPLREIASNLGRTYKAVQAQITHLDLAKQVQWTTEQEDALRRLYEQAGADGVLHLSEFAESIGREKGNVCRKAKQLGLTTNPRRKLVEVRKDRNKYDSPEELRAGLSASRKQWFRDNPHPRGFAGHKHTASALLKISAASKAQQLFQTEEQKQERALKGMKTRAARYGSVNVAKVGRGTWKAAWHEIGGKRNFYRSRWESNYARYLQWLKDGGHIADWQHEPETFWFEQIKRGTRSYLPDFRVWENDGSSALHEVKGWMDQRSRTTLARMKKYHPHERIVLIDGAQYRAIRLKVMRLVPGWEDAARDAHA